jgi:hypothetical protein
MNNRPLSTISRRRIAFRSCAAAATAALLFAVTAHASTPTNAAVELPFAEGPGSGNGLTTTNLGTLAGTGTFSDPAATNAFPAFSTNVPAGAYAPAGNGFSVDFGTFGTGAEGRAVDLVTTAVPPGDGSLGAFPKLTIAGWVNARTFSTRGLIGYALQGPGSSGFSFGHNSVGKLGLGINQEAQNAPASSFALPTDGDAGSNNWIFVAATYDPSLSSEQLKYYIGRADKLAALDSLFTYVGGDVTTTNVDFTGPLSVGNAGIVEPLRTTTSNAGNPLFRGLIDELKVYTNALTLEEIQEAQINGAVTPVAASIIRQPANKTVQEGQNAIFDVDATGSGLLTYQWKTNGVDVPNATNSSLTLANLTLADNGKLIRVGVSNAVGGVLSSNAVLIVAGANPHLQYLSFVEGNDRTTNITISATSQDINTVNVGSVAGGGHFVSRNSGANGIGAGTYPVFSPNVPVGAFAPSPAHNRFALHMGDVRYTNILNGVTGAGLVSGQGGRAVDLTNSVGSPVHTLGSMSGLTVCGWLNAGALTFRGNNSGMGGQIISAVAEPSRSGFALSHKSSWALQLNVNEWPGGALNHSIGFVPVATNSIDGNATFSADNWIFFAVTYDGTLTSANLNYYFGTPTNEVALDTDSPQSYNKGIITNTGPVTVGNLNPVTTLTGRTINGDNAAFFRGLIDELHIFSRVLTLEEIKVMQRAPALPAYIALATETNQLVLSWEQGTQPLLPALQLQSRTDLATGAWTDMTTTTNVAGSVRSIGLPVTDDARFFRLRTK